MNFVRKSKSVQLKELYKTDAIPKWKWPADENIFANKHLLIYCYRGTSRCK